MKRKKNGFTLIELLVAVAIMLSLLGIAIVSFIKVSDNKKKEAWESVKGQIETAAEEYFTYNEYLFEGLSDGATATISVGKLVSEDYLNKVTNPVTGKAVSECMVVIVTKTNGTYKMKVDENTESGSEANVCTTSNIVTISEVGAPELSVAKECGTEGENNWCKNDPNGVGVTVTADAPDAVSIQYATQTYGAGVWNQSSEVKNGKEYQDDDNTLGKAVCFLATGSNGARSSSCVDYKIDMELPKGNINISSSVEKYKSNKVNITGSVSDEHSGVASVSSTPKVLFDSATGKISKSNYELFDSFNGESKSITLKVKDKAGNEADIESNKYVVYKECDDTKFLETVKEVTTDCSGNCGGKKTIAEYDKYVDSVTEKECNREFVQNYQEDCKACPNLTCPDTKVLGTEGNNGWYKMGKKVYGDKYFALEITPTSGTSYWKWYTGYKGGSYTDWGKNEGTQTKTLDEGMRIAKIVIYDDFGNSKECPYSYNIDLTPPTVSCSSITVNHSCQNTSQSTYGYGNNTTITSKSVYSGYTYMVHRCEGNTPLVNKNCTVTDKLSGPSDEINDSFVYVSTMKSKGRNTCRITDGENPCDTEFILTGYDKAGNSADEIFKFISDYYSDASKSKLSAHGYTKEEFISK